MPLEEVIPTNDYIIVGGELYHYGVKGMKWGVRRYQNKDGTSTSLGKRRRQNLKDEASLLNRVKGPDDVDGWVNLQKEIHKKSGNFYFGEGVSPKFKKAIEEYGTKREEINKKYDTSTAWRKANNRLDEVIKGLKPEGYNVDFDTYHKIFQQAKKDPLYQQLYKEYRDLSRQNIKAYSSFRKTYDDKLAGIVLNDLGYENTAKGRQFLLDQCLIFDD